MSRRHLQQFEVDSLIGVYEGDDLFLGFFQLQTNHGDQLIDKDGFIAALLVEGVDAQEGGRN